MWANVLVIYDRFLLHLNSTAHPGQKLHDFKNYWISFLSLAIREKSNAEIKKSNNVLLFISTLNLCSDLRTPFNEEPDFKVTTFTRKRDAFKMKLCNISKGITCTLRTTASSTLRVSYQNPLNVLDLHLLQEPYETKGSSATTEELLSIRHPPPLHLKFSSYTTP